MKKLVVDCSTGVVAEIELTEEEIQQREADSQAWIAEQEERESEASAKAQALKSAEAKLKNLGLTANEIQALLS
jgi:dethiobiotin synthetase